MADKLRRGIEVRVQELQIKAEEIYGVSIHPTIMYGARGSSAGYAVFDSHTLDFNFTLAMENQQVFVEQIVGHEFAHLVANEVYGHRSHGCEWKEVMIEFDLNPDRCHKFDLTNVLRKPRTYPYSCSCNHYHFNKLTHHQMQSVLHQCNHCGGLVKYMGPQKDLRRFQEGTREHTLAGVLRDYSRLEIPANDQIILLMDFFNLSYSTARSYYYEYRPQLQK